MVLIKCDKKKFGCGNVMELDILEIENDETLQCDVCGRIVENPFFNGERKKPSYIN